MRYHKNLDAERMRRMPWKTQVGLAASELSRAQHLVQHGGGSEVVGCLCRARELLGILESSPILPHAAALELAAISRELCLKRLDEAASKSGALYARLMALYRD